MKSISKIIPHLVFSLLLFIASAATASGNDATEAARITEAMELYVQATPMEMNTPQRTEMLNRVHLYIIQVQILRI